MAHEEGFVTVGKDDTDFSKLRSHEGGQVRFVTKECLMRGFDYRS